MGNDEQGAGPQRPVFYTVAEAADMMRVNRATIYRAIREDAFPAVRVRNRYIVPAIAVEELAAEATQSGACVDVAAIAARRRREREAAHAIALDGGARDWRA